MTTIAEGGNYTLTLGDGILRIDIRPRRDLSYEEGAALAQELERHIHRLVARPDIVAVMMDFRNAPYVWGPVTEAALKRFFASIAAAGKRLAGLSTDTLQRFMVENLLRDTAPDTSKAFDEPHEARQWLLEPQS